MSAAGRVLRRLREGRAAQAELARLPREEQVRVARQFLAEVEGRLGLADRRLAELEADLARLRARREAMRAEVETLRALRRAALEWSFA